MTETKMLKILKGLSETFGADKEVFHCIDVWDDDKVREVFTIGHLIGFFQLKDMNNQIYSAYHITADFLKLVKIVEGSEPMKLKTYYEDSHKAYIDQWQTEHPGEDYDDWVRKQKMKRLAQSRENLSIYARLWERSWGVSRRWICY